LIKEYNYNIFISVYINIKDREQRGSEKVKRGCYIKRQYSSSYERESAYDEIPFYFIPVMLLLRVMIEQPRVFRGFFLHMKGDHHMALHTLSLHSTGNFRRKNHGSPEAHTGTS
jgi:hypothetical protein